MLSSDSPFNPHDEVFEPRSPQSRPSKADKRRAARAEKAEKNTPPGQRKPLVPKTETQRDYIEAIDEGESIFAVGPAGTGKTYIAARRAARALVRGDIEKIIVSRVTVSDPRHRIGFLPGKLEQKMAPWLIPVMEGICAEVSKTTLEKWQTEGKFEIAPFEYIRGRTFSNAFVILDEAQNATYLDLKTLLTRAGTEMQMIVCGDGDQVDIPDSGLDRVVEICVRYDVPMDVIEFTADDVVRSPLAKAWVKAFEKDKTNVANLDIRTAPPHSAPRRVSLPA